jgi:hypothetical protein
MPSYNDWPTNDEDWAFRQQLRLRDARWQRLEPTYNELEAALNKATAEIIALKAAHKAAMETALKAQQEYYDGQAIHQASWGG